VSFPAPPGASRRAHILAVGRALAEGSPADSQVGRAHPCESGWHQLSDFITFRDEWDRAMIGPEPREDDRRGASPRRRWRAEKLIRPDVEIPRPTNGASRPQ